MTWSAKILRQKNDVILLECRYPENRIAYFVCKIPEQKLASLNEAVAKGNSINLSDYGTVLASGWGRVPAYLSATHAHTL